MEAELDPYNEAIGLEKCYMKVWFAKAVGFLKIYLNTPAAEIEVLESTSFSEKIYICDKNPEAFLYMFLWASNEKNLTVYQIHTTLEFIRLQWK